MRSFFVFLLSVLFILAGCSVEKHESLKTLSWDFPLPRPHTGILVGNGVQGLMIWGEDMDLVLTVGRAGFWDHRGGNIFATSTTYREVTRLLQAGDHQGLRRVFNIPENSDPSKPRPHQIGGGRLKISFPDGWKLERGVLTVSNATVTIHVRDNQNKLHKIRIRQDIFNEVSWIEFPGNLLDNVLAEIIPSWEFTKEKLEAWGVKQPEYWDDGQTAGFCQYLPEDDPLALGISREQNKIILATALQQDAIVAVKDRLNSFNQDKAETESNDWWKDYWSTVPEINLPDPVLQEIVDYGLYKQACCTPPHGIACTLQGPFMESYQIPPWSNDYHFNINIEMIYWPALASNRTEHFTPLWGMVSGWMPELRKNAEHFFQTEGAIMLPHAVDNKGQIPGVFWTGMIDHGSTAWVAQMAWLNYRYSMDRAILEHYAWPLLKGAFEGYWAMLEKIVNETGKLRYSIPVTVSPEFRGSRMDAWGRDASFQLAALHMLVDILPVAATLMDEPDDPRWNDVADNLPDYTLISGPRTMEWPESESQRIALWDGMDLIESHRHHSYLAAIYPFCTIDPLAPEHKDIVENTLYHWRRKGPGAWSGWCVPWASVIFARTDNTEAAVSYLHLWHQNFTNRGRGTLHDSDFPGITTLSGPNWEKHPDIPMHETMQLDAGFGALNAVFELLVQNRQGTIHVLQSLHRDWTDLEFDGILTEGAFIVGATVKNGNTVEVRVKSKAGGYLKLAHGLGVKYLLNGEEFTGEILEKELKEGEKLVLTKLF